MGANQLRCSKCGGAIERVGQGGYCNACMAVYMREYRRKHRLKTNARKAANRAKKVGKLVQQACVVCGDPETEMHHEDYTKPLDVVWLCKKHHEHTHHACSLESA